jgi:protein phosphatase
MQMDTEVHLPPPETRAPGPDSPQPLAVRGHGLTHPGRVRPGNEDQFLVAVLNKSLEVQQTSLSDAPGALSNPVGHLFVVADGVGGSLGGSRASALAVSAIEDFMVDTLHWCRLLRGPEETGLLKEFQQALQQADARVFREGRSHPELRGMGTTLTLAYSFGHELFVAHVGDSRCYLLREGMLYRLTRDHTLVAEMVRRGVLAPEEAATHSFRHVVTNVVGGNDPGVQVELHKLPLAAGDRLLLCSDGLTEMVSEGEILGILKDEEDPEAACEHLVARANERGGKDNVTVVVARFD